MATIDSSARAGAVDAPVVKSRLIQGLSPDITPAQLAAIVGNVIAVAIAFGAHISKQQQDAVLALVGALGAFLIASDAHVRGRRAHATAIRHSGEANAAAIQAYAETVGKAIAAGKPPPPPPQP